MKFNFKKISAIVASTLMAGMTLGVAAAANYPAPFITAGTANVAIVYGANAAPTDITATGTIQTNLQSKLGAGTAGSTTPVTLEGDGYQFEKTSTKMHLGDNVTAIITTLDDGELPTLLADGTFTDNDNDEFDYKQEITVFQNLDVTLFDDDDFEVDSPTVGIEVADATALLNFSLEFLEDPLWVDLETADLPFMGKDYYVLDADLAANDSITLLDSAESTTLEESETTTITVGTNTYTVTAISIGETEVKFDVDGVTTNSLNEGETQRLASGAYLGVKDIVYSARETSPISVEFSIGKGKLVLHHGDEVELNEEDVDGLNVYVLNSGADGATETLDKITLEWNADGDAFIAGASEATFPSFETVKVSFGGLLYPAEEAIIVKANGDDNFELANFPLTGGAVETISLLYTNNTNFTIVGKDDNNRLATAGSGERLNFTEGTHDYFVLSYKSGDDAESYLVRATGFDDGTTDATSDNTVDFEYLTSSGWSDLDTNVNEADEVSSGLATFTVSTISNETNKTVTMTATGNNNFYKLYTKEGMEVILPWINRTTQRLSGIAGDVVASGCSGNYSSFALSEGQIGYNATLQNNTGSLSVNCYWMPGTYKLVLREEDKDDSIAAGDWINVTLGMDTDNEATIKNYTTQNTDATASEVGESDVYRDFTYSALATEILDDQSGDHENIKFIYHGGEVEAQVFLLGADSVISGGEGTTTQLGDIVVTDAQVGTVATKNLIIVGGSCINSAAAALVGGKKCGTAWTDATDVGTGQFLIKGYADAQNGALTNKLALLVAGYEAADTVNAVTYLTTKTVDTSVGGIGTTATASLTAFS